MHRFGSKVGPAVLVALCIGAGAAWSGEIYRWVDDQGVTHIGDSVPEVYKARAKVVGSTESSLSPEQQKESEARAAKEAERLKELQAATPAPDQAPGAAAPTPQPPPQPRPSSSAPDCAALWAAYNASNACFSQYVTVNGHKASNCVSVPDPSVQCGTTMAPAP